MYDYEIHPDLQKILEKLIKKDNLTRERIIKKIEEIISSFNVEHYKNLKKDLKDLKRVHIREKVLVFRFYKKDNLIVFLDFDHHDKIYRRKM